MSTEIEPTRIRLSQPQKAAALVMAVGTKEASALLGFLTESEVEQLAAEIASLRQLPGEVLEDVIEELHEEAVARSAVLTGGIDYARDLLSAWKGTRGEEILQKIVHQSQESPFSFLADVEPQELVQYLQGEHPQTLALVLSHLPAGQSASVLSLIDPALQSEVAIRIAHMDRISPEVVRRVEESLRSRMGFFNTSAMSQRGGVRELAGILNSTDRTTERAILSGLENHDEELAEEVRSLMFLFEDIIGLNDRDIQEVLRTIDPKSLALALKGVGDDVRDAVMRNVSERARETLQEEIEVLGAVRIKEVEEAQTKIVASIRKLDEEGKIIMRRDAEGGLVE
jgi:flagellar motor switch protein FliG